MSFGAVLVFEGEIGAASSPFRVRVSVAHPKDTPECSWRGPIAFCEIERNNIIGEPRWVEAKEEGPAILSQAVVELTRAQWEAARGEGRGEVSAGERKRTGAEELRIIVLRGEHEPDCALERDAGEPGAAGAVRCTCGKDGGG